MHWPSFYDQNTAALDCLFVSIMMSLSRGTDFSALQRLLDCFYKRLLVL